MQLHTDLLVRTSCSVVESSKMPCAGLESYDESVESA